jgi:hypothetical protein
MHSLCRLQTTLDEPEGVCLGKSARKITLLNYKKRQIKNFLQLLIYLLNVSWLKFRTSGRTLVREIKLKVTP